MKQFIFTIAMFLFIGTFSKIIAWNEIPTGINATLKSVYFPEANIGYAVGSNGTILKTIDAGMTWVTQNSGVTTNFNSVFFTNVNIGYVIGYTNTPVSTVLKTIDGGQNWTVLLSNVSSFLRSVYFTSDSVGYLVGSNSLILKTIDGGLNWITQTSPITGQFYSVSFIDNNNGLIVGGNGYILKTSDGGVNWALIPSGTTKNLTAVFFVNSTTAYITGYSGVFLKTIDGGTTWITQPAGDWYVSSSLFFTNDSTGYLLGNGINKTTNGGISWVKQSIPNSLYGGAPNTVFFTNNLTGYIVGYTNIILKTNIGGGYKDFDFMDASNINAQFNTSGPLFCDLQSWSGFGFEVPKGSGKTSLFVGDLWIGGKDIYNNLHVTADRYRSNGPVFYPGPIMKPSDYFNDQEKWNRIWVVTKNEVENHKLYWSNSNYFMPTSISEWPGSGDTAKGQTPIIAPYFDFNNDGKYTPQLGDYPLIKGDKSLFFIINDSMQTQFYNEIKLGIELKVMAYAFDCPNDSAFWNTLFLNYEIVNRSQNNYDSSFVGFFSDLDLGEPTDDYFATDVKRGSIFSYNADAMDGDGNGNTYGANPPAQSITFLGGPYMDSDGSDFGSSGIAEGCDESINGLNFNDSIVDNERFGMCKSMYCINSSGVQGDPSTAQEYYNYLCGKWKNGTQLTYGETGIGGTVASNFMYPDDTDPCGWGTLTPQSPWKQTGTPYDIRGIATMGPFTFLHGAIHQVDIAFVFGRDYVNPDPKAGVVVMQERIDSVRKAFITNSSPCGPFSEGIKENEIKKAEINIYPNPANNYFNIRINNNEQKILTLYTIEGVFIKKTSFTETECRIETNSLSAGLYIVEVKTNLISYYKKVIITK